MPFGQGVTLEHGPVRAWLELDGAGRLLGLPGCLPRDSRRIDVGRPPCRPLRVARAARVCRHHECGRVGHPLLDAEAGRRCDGKLGDAAREEAVDGNRARSLDRLPRKSRLILRQESRRISVVAFDRGGIGPRSQPGVVIHGRRTLCRVTCATGELGQTVRVDPIRAGDTGPRAAEDPEGDDGVLDQRRLMDLGSGEPRESRPLEVPDGFGFSIRRLECRPRELEGGHAPTPTWTALNRAGAAPCDTWALCPGWPLPQFVMP